MVEIFANSRLQSAEMPLRRYYLLLALVFIIANTGMILLLNWEQFNYLGGLAWDARIYANMVQQGIENLANKEISQYHIQRILPSVLVGGTLKALHLPPTDGNIFKLFTYLSFISINLIVATVVNTLAYLKQPASVKLIAGVLMFFNVCLFKCGLFIPVSTDVLSLLMSAIILNLYFRNRPVLLLFFTFLASFTHPFMLFIGCILFCLPKKQAIENNYIDFKNYNTATKIMLLLCIAGTILVYYAAYSTIIITPLNEGTPVYQNILPLSFLAILFYISIIANFVFRMQVIKHLWQSVMWKRVLVATTLLIIVKVIQLKIASNQVGPLSGKAFISNLVVQSVVQPFISLISHINFLGATIILVILNFKRFLAESIQLGGGFLAVVIIGLGLFIGSETRQFGFLLPYFIIAISIALTPQLRNPATIFSIIAVALLLTRFWYKINLAPFTGHPQRFPDQRLFMVYGPWVNFHSYLILGTLALVGTLWLGIAKYIAVKKTQSEIKVQ